MNVFVLRYTSRYSDVYIMLINVVHSILGPLPRIVCKSDCAIGSCWIMSNVPVVYQFRFLLARSL